MSTGELFIPGRPRKYSMDIIRDVEGYSFTHEERRRYSIDGTYDVSTIEDRGWKTVLFLIGGEGPDQISLSFSDGHPTIQEVVAELDAGRFSIPWGAE